MSDSILASTKASLGLVDGQESFDPEIIMFINAALADLTQIGVGPVEGFEITSANETWNDYLGSDPRFKGVPAYIHLRVKMLFDPPEVGFVLTAMKEQIEKAEWRLNFAAEVDTVTPVVVVLPEEGGF